MIAFPGDHWHKTIFFSSSFGRSVRRTHSRSLRTGPMFMFGPVLRSSTCRPNWYLERSLLAMLDFAFAGRLDTSVTTCVDIACSMVSSTTAATMLSRLTAASKEHVVVSVGKMGVTVDDRIFVVTGDRAPP